MSAVDTANTLLVVFWAIVVVCALAGLAWWVYEGLADRTVSRREADTGPGTVPHLPSIVVPHDHVQPRSIEAVDYGEQRWSADDTRPLARVRTEPLAIGGGR